MNNIIFEFLSKHYGIFSINDAIEIILFSIIIYHFSLWLKKDQTKNLIIPFYGICILAVLAVFLQLPTLSSFFLWYGPTLLMLFMLMHQEILQRNFIASPTIKHRADANSYTWIKPLIQACLRARNNNKNIRVIIEKNTALASFVTTEFMIQAPLQYHLLNTLLESSSFQAQKMLWLNHSGTIIAMNSDWSINAHEAWMSEELKEKDPWLADALLFTSKTDALAFSCSGQSDTFTIITHGKLIENVYAPDALKIINHYIARQPSSKKGDSTHEPHPLEKQHYQQPNH